MDPVTLAVMSAVLGGYSSIAGGMAQAGAFRSSQKIGRYNAIQITKETNEAEYRQRRSARTAIGRQRAAVSANGLAMTGSALDWLEESSAMAELDALNIRYEGTSRAIGARYQANMAGLQADEAMQAGYLGAGAAALGGVADYARYTS